MYSGFNFFCIKCDIVIILTHKDSVSVSPFHTDRMLVYKHDVTLGPV